MKAPHPTTKYLRYTSLLALAVLTIILLSQAWFHPWKLRAEPQWLGPTVYEYALHPIFWWIGMLEIGVLGAWWLLSRRQHTARLERIAAWSCLLISALVIVLLTLQDPPPAMG